MGWMVIPLLMALGGLCYAYKIYLENMSHSEGDEKMVKIARAVQLGAMAFLKTEYLRLGIFVLVVFFVLQWIPGIGLPTAVCFLFGAILSIALGLMLWSNWPLSGAWAVGVFVGIWGVFTGWALVNAAAVVKEAAAASD